MHAVASAIQQGLQSTIGAERMVAAVVLARWTRIGGCQDANPCINQLADQCQAMLANGGSNPPQGFLELQHLCRGLHTQLAALLKQAATAGFAVEVPHEVSHHCSYWMLQMSVTL